jgi:hypothetical protein
VKRTLGLVACLTVAGSFAGMAGARIPERPPAQQATRTPAQPAPSAVQAVPDGFGPLNRLLTDGNAYPAMAWL